VQEEVLPNFGFAAAGAHESIGALYAPRLQAPVRSRVRSVDWRRESQE
jgi:hypothetical protein